MSDRKAAAELIRKLKKQKYTVVPHSDGRVRVVVDEKSVVIPGPKHITSGRAMRNAKAALKRDLGIEI
jgi:hypothetical protein